jgi:hypothetical protein
MKPPSLLDLIAALRNGMPDSRRSSGTAKGKQIASRCRDLALFSLAIDSKLRACDLMQLRVPR